MSKIFWNGVDKDDIHGKWVDIPEHIKDQDEELKYILYARLKHKAKLASGYYNKKGNFMDWLLSKSVNIILWAIIVLVVFSVLVFSIDVYNNTIGKPEPKIGDVWISADSTDPFKPINWDTIIVLDTSRGYAKVNWNGRITSMRFDLVTHRAKVINGN